MPDKAKIDLKIEISKNDIERLARCFLPGIQKFFESEEGQREFEEWKNRQAEKQIEKET